MTSTNTADFTIKSWSFCNTSTELVANSDRAKTRLGGAISYTVGISALPKIEEDLIAEGFSVEVH
jgi:hypothetical protein